MTKQCKECKSDNLGFETNLKNEVTGHFCMDCGSDKVQTKKEEQRENRQDYDSATNSYYYSNS